MYDLKTIKQMNKGKPTSKLLEPLTHTLTIGRNIGNVPLSNHRWKGFQSAINSFIDSHDGEVFVNSEGYGIWNGIKEDNCTWVFSSLEFLDKTHLKRLCKLFKQDSIALTTGTTQLIGEK